MRVRHKILVVDDSTIALELARIRLEEAGFDVETLDSPFGFSAALRSQKPDLVLLDVSMPALQGDRLLQIAHRNVNPSQRGATASQGSCPVVLYSDRPEQELAALAHACGADGYVRKVTSRATPS
jgi:CheY-like chemotaxis protein